MASSSVRAKEAAGFKSRKQILTPEVKLKRLYDTIAEDPDLNHLRYQRHLIRGHGPINPLVMLIVEMPEPNDEQHGVPLTGPGGVVLHDMLKVADLKRTNDVFVTPLIKYRPYGNREATQKELAVLLPYLMKELEIVDPKYVITCGRYVNKIFFPKTALADMCGEIVPWRNRFFLPTKHPLSAIHDPDNRRVIAKTFKILGDLA